MKVNSLIGSYGERVAAFFLSSRGYKIISKNIRVGPKEIDILALSGSNQLVFVEVKTCKIAKIQPVENFTSKKIHNLLTGIVNYLQRFEHKPVKWRLDLICVNLGLYPITAKVQHYKNVLNFIQ